MPARRLRGRLHRREPARGHDLLAAVRAAVAEHDADLREIHGPELEARKRRSIADRVAIPSEAFDAEWIEELLLQVRVDLLSRGGGDDGGEELKGLVAVREDRAWIRLDRERAHVGDLVALLRELARGRFVGEARRVRQHVAEGHPRLPWIGVALPLREPRRHRRIERRDLSLLEEEADREAGEALRDAHQLDGVERLAERARDDDAIAMDHEQRVGPGALGFVDELRERVAAKAGLLRRRDRPWRLDARFDEDRRDLRCRLRRRWRPGRRAGRSSAAGHREQREEGET